MRFLTIYSRRGREERVLGVGDAYDPALFVCDLADAVELLREDVDRDARGVFAEPATSSVVPAEDDTVPPCAPPADVLVVPIVAPVVLVAAAASAASSADRSSIWRCCRRVVMGLENESALSSSIFVLRLRLPARVLTPVAAETGAAAAAPSFCDSGICSSSVCARFRRLRRGGWLAEDRISRSSVLDSESASVRSSSDDGGTTDCGTSL